MKTTPLSFRYELEKKEPRTNDVGTTRGASVTDFPASIGIPISSTISGSITELQPGALREMHWHPNGFNSGTYQSVDLSKWIAGNPKDVVVTNFGLKDGEIEKFPTEKIFIQPKI